MEAVTARWQRRAKRGPPWELNETETAPLAEYHAVDAAPCKQAQEALASSVSPLWRITDRAKP